MDSPKMDSKNVTAATIAFLMQHLVPSFANFSNYSEVFQANGSTNVTEERRDDARIIGLLCFCTKIVIITVGLLGNTISIVEFLKCTKIVIGNVGHYLIFLAVADILVLISEVPIWMLEPPLEYFLLDKYDWLCRTTYFLKYTARIWSASLTLTITIERYLFVAHPLRRSFFQKTRFYRILIPATFCLSGLCVLYTPFLVKLQSQVEGETLCHVAKDQREVFRILDVAIVRVVGDAVIGGLMLLFTILCTNVLRKAQRLRQANLQEMSSLCSSCGNQIHRIHHQNSRSRESQITKMLLTIPVVFLLFKIPYTILYYCTFDLHDKTSLTTTQIVLTSAKRISEAFSLFSYAFNFFVYIMLIPTFRATFVTVFECWT